MSWAPPHDRSGDSSRRTVVLGGASSAKQEKALLNKLREFQKADIGNKRCAECGDVGPTYICMDFGIFVCTTCSGLHREFNHKVKGLSVSSWSTEEVQFILSHGNSKAREIFMKKYSGDIQQPEPGQIQKLRHWLRYKYIDQRWSGQTVESSTSHTSADSCQSNCQIITKAKPIKTSGISTDSTGSPKKALPSSSRRRHRCKSKTAELGGTNLLGLDDSFDPFAIQSQSTSATPHLQGTSSSTPLEFAPFLADFTVQSAPTELTRPPISSCALSHQDPHHDSIHSPQNPPFHLPAASSSHPSSGYSTIASDPFAHFAHSSPLLSNPHQLSTILRSGPTIDPQSSVDALGTGCFPSLTTEPPQCHTGNRFSSSPSPVHFISNNPNPVTTGVPVHSISSPKLTEQMASQLAKSLMSSQRYQGDPFAEISMDYMPESSPVDIKKPVTPSALSKSLNPSSSMTSKNIQQSDSLSYQEKSLSILTNQVAALNDALQEMHIGSSIEPSAHEANHKQLEHQHNEHHRLAFSTDSSGSSHHADYHKGSSKASSPISQFSLNRMQSLQQKDHLSTSKDKQAPKQIFGVPSTTTSSTNAKEISVSTHFSACSQLTTSKAVDCRATTDFDSGANNAIDTAAGSVLDSVSAPLTPSGWNLKPAYEPYGCASTPFDHCDWADFDTIPPFAEGTPNSATPEGVNPFHVF